MFSVLLMESFDSVRSVCPVRVSRTGAPALREARTCSLSSWSRRRYCLRASAVIWEGSISPKNGTRYLVSRHRSFSVVRGRIAGLRSRSTSQSVASSANVGSRSKSMPVGACPGCHKPRSIFASSWWRARSARASSHPSLVLPRGTVSSPPLKRTRSEYVLVPSPRGRLLSWTPGRRGISRRRRGSREAAAPREEAGVCRHVNGGAWGWIQSPC